MKRSKRYIENFNKLESDKKYNLDEAFDIISSSPAVKFDQTVDLSINLGVDPRHADQVIRGTVSLPHGTGKDVKVLDMDKLIPPPKDQQFYIKAAKIKKGSSKCKNQRFRKIS